MQSDQLLGACLQKASALMGYFFTSARQRCPAGAGPQAVPDEGGADPTPASSTSGIQGILFWLTLEPGTMHGVHVTLSGCLKLRLDSAERHEAACVHQRGTWASTKQATLGIENYLYFLWHCHTSPGLRWHRALALSTYLTQLQPSFPVVYKLVSFTEWQRRAVGHYQVSCKALSASEVTERACYFGKYQLHTSKMAWRSKMLSGNKSASVQKVSLCSDHLFLVQNKKPGGHRSKPAWQTPLTAPLRHKGNIVPVICGTLRGGDVGLSDLVFYSLDTRELIY